MSLFDVNVVEIKIYYTFKEKENYKILIVLKDEKAKELLEDESQKGKIESLTTKWSIMNWREQNALVETAYNKTNSLTGERAFDHVLYRDIIVKSCLKEWDIVVEGKNVPVTANGIDSLPAEIIMEMYYRYEKMIDYSEDELGK